MRYETAENLKEPGEVRVLRAEEEWQRAGAYAVRVEGMNRQYHIPLQEEFDELDGEESKYIVLLDEEYPFATCRFFEAEKKTEAAGHGMEPGDSDTVSIGRVVVLPEYRGREYGRRVIEEAEAWIKELGYRKILLDSRVEAAGFYRKLGYSLADGTHYQSGPFECVQMYKELD